MKLGTQLRQIRKSKNVSVYKLAKETDVSANYIHNIENGVNQPSIFILEVLLDYLGVTLSEFFKTGEDVIYPTGYEADLIGAVRRLSDEKAQAVLHVARLMSQ